MSLNSANSVAYKELIKEILNKQARIPGMGISSKWGSPKALI